METKIKLMKVTDVTETTETAIYSICTAMGVWLPCNKERWDDTISNNDSKPVHISTRLSGNILTCKWELSI